jgi:hypothetical protein
LPKDLEVQINLNEIPIIDKTDKSILTSEIINQYSDEEELGDINYGSNDLET